MAYQRISIPKNKWDLWHKIWFSSRILKPLTMRKFLLLPTLSLFLIIGCSSSDDNSNNPLIEKQLLNVAYGSDNEQKMDVYLPANRDHDTKVLLLLHGGSWVAGNKSDMSYLVPIIQSQFPDYAIVNINYRLATATSPAFPKQIEDIQKAIQFLKNNNYHISDNYAFIGFSAGAHLSMLYGYSYNTAGTIKAICNVVGPADFSDPAYTTHPLYSEASLNLIGTATPSQNQITEVSPLAHITAQSPPTISFYGGQDPLIPSTQGPRLQQALDNANVSNEFNFYPNGGHADWDNATMVEVYGKITVFLQNHF